MDGLLARLLQKVVEKNASDLFLVVGSAPSLKINGRIIRAGQELLTREHVEAILHSIIPAQALEMFEKTHEANFAFSGPGLPRFRANAFVQRNSPGIVIRQIQSEIKTPTDLGLPSGIETLAFAKRGLVFVVGATGTGKSTTLASLINHRNRLGQGHIITIEDPIEYVHSHNGCLVTQREVGVDTDSFEAALENTLRQAPDVIVIGEVRSREAMQHAIAFAETGHLVLATLHANNANQALERILHFFPSDSHDRVRLDLALNLRAVLAQQLLPTRRGQALTIATELLSVTPLIAEKIRTNQLHEIKEAMAKSNTQSMHTFDQSLFDLHMCGKISYDTALKHADSMNNLRVRIKLAKDRKVGSGEQLERAGLSE